MAISDEIAVFCGNVKILREQHGLTKNERARIMGISPASLRRGCAAPRRALWARAVPAFPAAPLAPRAFPMNFRRAPRKHYQREVITMSCPINPYQDEAMQQYFQSLPPFVQENIMMCNPEVDNLEELRQCAEHLLSQNNQ